MTEDTVRQQIHDYLCNNGPDPAHYWITKLSVLLDRLEAK